MPKIKNHKVTGPLDLTGLNAKTALLPDNVMRRHINAAKKNPDIKELQVSPNCPLFAYEDGKLMNKRKTTIIFGGATSQEG